MALTAEQIKMLEGMDGIDQGLLSGYKSRNATPTLNAPTQTAADVVTTSEANPDLTGPQKAADTGGVDQQSDFTNFTVAVNKGIDMARQQRQDMVLDTVGGMAPAGALPASSFASVIDQFNRSAAPIQSEMIGAALDERQNETDRLEKNKNSIRELALSVSAETGDSKAAQMIAALADKGDMDGALDLAVVAFGDEYTREENRIVNSKTGADVFSTEGMRDVNFGPQGAPSVIPFVDYATEPMKFVDKDMAEYMPEVYTAISQSKLKDDTKRKLFNDWLGTMDRAGQYIPAEDWLKSWLEIEPGVSVADVFGGGGSKSSDKEEESTDSLLGIPE